MARSIYAEDVCNRGTGKTSVNIPSPITISSPTVALSLNLQVSQSYTLSTPAIPGPPVYSFSPTFTLAPLALVPRPTTEQNGKFIGINALITSVDSVKNTFVAQTPNPFSLTVSSAATTTYQGVAGFSTLAAGTLVNLDLAIQPDASLLAIRVEVDNLSARMNSIGFFVGLTSQPGSFDTIVLQAQGCYPALRNRL